jgi:hypothetical protein
MSNEDRTKIIYSRTPESAAMLANVKRAMAITATLNRLTFNDADEIRALFSELIGKKVDESFLLIPPFYIADQVRLQLPDAIVRFAIQARQVPHDRIDRAPLTAPATVEPIGHQQRLSRWLRSCPLHGGRLRNSAHDGALAVVVERAEHSAPVVAFQASTRARSWSTPTVSEAGTDPSRSMASICTASGRPWPASCSIRASRSGDSAPAGFA